MLGEISPPEGTYLLTLVAVAAAIVAAAAAGCNWAESNWIGTIIIV